MLGKRFSIAVLCVVTLFAASVAAQDEKNEIGGIIGRTFISDQGIKLAIPDPIIHFGKGLTFEGEYARSFYVAPIYSLSGEVLVAYNHDIDLNGGAYGFSVVPPDMKSLLVTPAARVNLCPTTAVSPWVSLGAGFGRFTESSQLVYGGTNTGQAK